MARGRGNRGTLGTGGAVEGRGGRLPHWPRLFTLGERP